MEQPYQVTIQTLHQPAHLHWSDAYLPLSLVPARLTDTSVSIQFSPPNRYKWVNIQLTYTGLLHMYLTTLCSLVARLSDTGDPLNTVT